MAVNIIECLCNGESKEFVKITRAEYEQLLEFLEALQASGVDNWEGYEAAQEMIAVAPCAPQPVLPPKQEQDDE